MIATDTYVLPKGPKLNLGCGPVQPPGWVNVDARNRAWLASRLPWLDRALTSAGVLNPTEFGPKTTVCDLSKPLPWPTGSVACIYAGELWEHFELEDAARLTRECFRVPAPRGVLRICVPDGPEFWRKYLQLYDCTMARPRRNRSAAPLREMIALYYREICTRRPVFGSMGHVHKGQYDEVQLVELLESSGFTKVARAALHDSRIDDVAQVERSDFLIVEGLKLSALT